MIGDEGYGFFPSSRRVGLLCGLGGGTRELKGPGVQVRSKIGQNRTIQRSAKTASEYKRQSTKGSVAGWQLHSGEVSKIMGRRGCERWQRNDIMKWRYGWS